MKLSEKHHSVLCGAAILAWAVMEGAAGRTVLMTESSYERWTKGDAVNVMIEPEGRLRLGPEIVATGVFPMPMVDAAVAAGDGRVFVSFGGKVYEQRPDGSNVLVVAFEQEKVTAMAIDEEERLYLGVSPGGVIYRVEEGGKVLRVADTGQRYIWALVALPHEELLAGTGHKGILQRITLTGATARVSTVLDSPEENITAVATCGGVVYAGTSPRGYVYRVEGTNQAFLVVDTRGNEVTSLLVESNGVVWAAVMGSAPAAGSAGVAGTVGPAGPLSAFGSASGAITGAAPAAVVAGPTGGARLWRILTNGFSEVYWQSPESVLYGLAQGADGTVYVGSGNKGRLYAMRGRGRAALVAQLPARQVMAIQPSGEGRLAVVCTEPAWLYVLGTGVAASGRFESAVLSATDVVKWGRVEIEEAEGRQVRVLTRSGNNDTPDSSWSVWEELGSAGEIKSPAARALQYALELKREGTSSPVVRSVKVYYAEPNRAPVIDVVAVSPAHTELVAQPVQAAGAPGGGPVGQMIQEWLAAGGAGAVAGGAAVGAGVGMPAGATPVLRLGTFGMRTVAWQAQDPNGDTLVARVWISRASAKPEWVLLARERRTSFFTFNAREWEDGRYRVRVRVSDIGSVPAGEALSAERESDTFVIDNTPPEFAEVKVERMDGKVRVRCRVRDALSNIASLSYVIDGKEARALAPVDDVFDARVEEFDVVLPVGHGAKSLRLIASDEQKNVRGIVRLIEKK